MTETTSAEGFTEELIRLARHGHPITIRSSYARRQSECDHRLRSACTLAQSRETRSWRGSRSCFACNVDPDFSWINKLAPIEGPINVAGGNTCRNPHDRRSDFRLSQL